MKDYTIRLENKDEHHEVETLVREAFWNVYRPGCTEHYILHCLRKDASFVKELDFVLEIGNRLVGQVACMKSVLQASEGSHTVLTLGPISRGSISYRKLISLTKVRSKTMTGSSRTK